MRSAEQTPVVIAEIIPADLVPLLNMLKTGVHLGPGEYSAAPLGTCDRAAAAWKRLPGRVRIAHG